ncbi:alpha/beta fold hydrolase [Phytohabitans rumicis]|uniref:Hydrolase n=1 Tax=Phytohabitans rumicis TaxID=1076125 RepID=A0A6V8LMI4_9ACTN|nr:alpha/beta fold hydrolase [Phytohabitans rumicis]GFJ93855.1 hydrolase [Phytohabitans rumicis]
MRTLRRAGTAALALATVAAIAIVGTPGTATATTRLSWTACGPRLECADVTVPLDWAHPRGPTITLPVIRHLASHPERRIGSLFVNPGGPGDSGVEMAATRGAALDAATEGRFDVVGWDIRGAGGDARVDCFGDVAARESFWANLPIPTTGPDQRRYLAATTEFARRCGERNGDLLAHISTADTARDLDHLRRLVGDRQLTYLGESYGTLIGQVYANMFPSRVRAMALDGLADPTAATHGTAAAIAAGLTGTDETFDQFLATCAAAGPELCPLAGHGPVAPRVNAMLDRLRTTPLPAPNATPPGTLAYNEALAPLKFAILGHPSLWPEAAAALEMAIQGDGSAIKDAANFDSSEVFHRLVEPGQAISCADSPARQDAADWPRVVRKLTKISRIGGAPVGWGMGAACTSWPTRNTNRYTGPWNATTRTPILLLGNRYEPNAPLAVARKVERLLGNAVLLVHDGYGHLSVADPSTCVTRATGDYLVRLVTPRPGTVCPSDRRPFDPDFGQPAS